MARSRSFSKKPRTACISRRAFLPSVSTRDVDAAMIEGADDLVQPFEVKPLGVRGRLVRLGPAVDDILHRHDYPFPVSSLLGEAIALTAMLGSALKFDGKFILQAKGDGPVDILVADYSTSGGMRGYARFDPEAVSTVESAEAGRLLGEGHLAMTVDQGAELERYQGIVALAARSLSEVAN